MPHKPQPITASPQAVADWIARHGGDITALAPVLGRSRNLIAGYRDNGAPRAIALAMAAIDAGLPPLSEDAHRAELRPSGERPAETPTPYIATSNTADMRAAKRAARRSRPRRAIDRRSGQAAKS